MILLGFTISRTKFKCHQKNRKPGKICEEIQNTVTGIHYKLEEMRNVNEKIINYLVHVLWNEYIMHHECHLQIQKISGYQQFII